MEPTRCKKRASEQRQMRQGADCLRRFASRAIASGSARDLALATGYSLGRRIASSRKTSANSADLRPRLFPADALAASARKRANLPNVPRATSPGTTPPWTAGPSAPSAMPPRPPAPMGWTKALPRAGPPPPNAGEASPAEPAEPEAIAHQRANARDYPHDNSTEPQS